ncbi:MAG: 3'-5' exoribonuclease 1 [Myxococcota bacterium]
MLLPYVSLVNAGRQPGLEDIMGQQRDYLVVDLEATCDRGGFPRDLMETIEIGAVYVDGKTLQPLEEFQTFIKPIRRTQLTAFCTELTSITQADVDAAPLFGEAITALGKFLGSRLPRFCSWGDYDWHQLSRDARMHGLRLPMKSDNLNLKQAFSDAHGTRKRFGMKAALKKVGIPLDGTHHRGIDDARNITKLLPWCLGQGEPSPQQRRVSHRQRRREQDQLINDSLRKFRK